MRPSVVCSRWPLPPQRPAMISAAMLIGGLLRRPGTEVQPDRAGEPRELLVAQPRLAQPRQAVVVGTARAHRADVGELGQVQRDLEQRYVELGVVGQHGDDGARVDPAGLGLGLEVPVRPVDDHLVGVGERLWVAKTGRASQTVTW